MHGTRPFGYFATGDLERSSYCTMECLLLLSIDDARAAALTAIENLQRDDGTPLEQAMTVARAREAGNYSSVAETAEALGLPRIRVRQYLELADAPPVVQRAVSPGVLISADKSEPRRLALPITSVLEARPYYEFFLGNRLAELKAKASVQRKRNERRGRHEEKLEAKERELARLQVEAVEFATEKTEHRLARAAHQGWTGAQVHAQVRLATRATAPSQPQCHPIRCVDSCHSSAKARSGSSSMSVVFHEAPMKRCEADDSASHPHRRRRLLRSVDEALRGA
jgi:hypothetical protein